ncbi:TetR/AcrR family transcriptional regulator [Streptomyces sp. HNM0575]|uniref:TetR/AcrR family transcriptional regulator n=1 Tax=Streptomyces sp. HNM0575 TaxID=2716338 RepID=UPI00145FB636|nr:TetR/AcrR family transcriptional regulator [Streptomyces sp. HNM0575]NLU72743.1 TetR/AcrR family transcriptional regulator [Streptomyces sp. HNM0575]
MAGRPVNQQRRDELLDAVVSYAVEHGFAGMTWRPLATALGVTPTTLVHRFRSKEGMIEAVQQRLRERILAETAPSGEDGTDLASYARRVWARVSDPVREGEFRLFFAVYGQALQAPGLFEDFLGHVVADPLKAFSGSANGDGRTGTDAGGGGGDAGAQRTATLLIATIRGLLLDLLTTGDRDRVGAAAEAFFKTLPPNAPATGSSSGS